MKNFIIRYYYITENKKDMALAIKDISGTYNLELISQSISPNFIEHQDCIYMYQHSVNKMTIIAVALESEDSSNVGAWTRLKTIDGEFKDDIVGKMTVFFNNCSIEELFIKDDVVISLIDDEAEGPIKGTLSLLSWNNENCESNFCYAALEETVASQMLSQDMPLTYGKLINLHKLSSKLMERNVGLQCEKSDLDRQLINILNSKLTLSNNNLKDTEELEKDIEWLAVTFSKMIAHQNLNRDGIKKLKTRLDLLENHIKQDTNLMNYINIFDSMTYSLHEGLSELERTDEELSLLREEYKAAIDVIQSRIQVINERTNRATQDQIKKLLEVNSDMQKKGIVYQYAAAMIEFIVLTYYSHTLWTHLAHTAYSVIPAWIQFIVVLLFSGNTVLVTHLAAEYIQGEKHEQKIMRAASVSLAIIIIFILVGSAFAEIKGINH